ncbi:sensor domain-containing diguanylate cyclase [Zavarzinia compransoris]|uniref:GGDEF domain-containing protein n=1 Tax=Zavarzinia marina TaxID=2911065 RepID=UPI001F17D671|nr:sensor domain-containing diguanylate cyclase [Zavarzinia marina]MCF4167049.1 sensor domain-containing diguanylate cyclase [Zavarzinia marina]
MRDFGGRPGLKAGEPAERYVAAMERLLLAVQELSMARSLGTVQRIVRTVARELTGCDGATFVLRDGPYCHYADEDAIEPLWKGRRFLQETCISGWVMRQRRPVIIPDIYVDERIPQDAYRPTFVRSLAMVPIRTIDPIGAIGNYWAEPHMPDEDDVRLLQALADSTSMAMENVQLYEELEQRVRERTDALARAKAEIETLSVTDPMTGLLNRRGFYMAAEAAMKKGPCALAFIDVDGLKRVNDAHGHAAGDELLRQFAGILRHCFRHADALARMGGDEFCAVLPEPATDEAGLRQSLQRRLDEFNATGAFGPKMGASLGAVLCAAGSSACLDDHLAAADQRMYIDKIGRRSRASADEGDARP